MKYNKLLNNIKKVHFIGIGGVSMSGLAHILLSKGFQVSGSDAKKSALTDQLQSEGVTISFSQVADNITEDIDLVVYTAAIHKDNPELMAAHTHGIQCISRAMLLGSIMTMYSDSIAVAGTHGKTTTTSMIGHILLEAKVSPTISVGGILNRINGNILVGDSNIFVTEACEYTNSYHEFYPYIGIIQNIEADHLDFFKDLNDIRQSFSKFMNNIHPEGFIVINEDIDHYEDLIKNNESGVITYSMSNPNVSYYADNIQYDFTGNGSYDLYEDGQLLGTIELNTKGPHNVSNSLAAIASCRKINIPFASIQSGLKGFEGTKRRYEEKGMLRSITVIDDYAHHPTAIETTIETARKTNPNHLWIAFQPHTYTRTHSLLEAFAKALSLADGIIVTDIYAAREPDTGLVHAKDLVAAIKQYNPNAHYIASFDDIEIFILQHLEDKDTFMTMGAGDIYLVGDDLLS